MNKYLSLKETYNFYFTDEDRKKIRDLLFEISGLTNISKVIIEPFGMQVEVIKGAAANEQ